MAKRRSARPFPASTFSAALDFAAKVYEIGAGQPVRRMTLFNELGKSPESGASRQLIVNAGRYGLTKGGYQAEFIELTPAGLAVVSEASTPREAAKAKIECAINSTPQFRAVYEKFIGNKLPSNSVLIDSLIEAGVDEEFSEEAADTLVINLKDVGLLKMLSGAERLISEEMLLDELPSLAERRQRKPEEGIPAESKPKVQAIITSEHANFEQTAFYISPIGEEDSGTRRHADLFSASIVEPALEQSKLRLVRADKIDRPGIITQQIIEYIVRSRLVIVDLSFHNPNVFYELAIRHMLRKPVVQIMRSSDRIPFDINQSRIIRIDDSSIYTLIPQMPVYISQISTQIRQALDDADSADNPVSIYFPNLKAEVEI